MPPSATATHRPVGSRLVPSPYLVALAVVPLVLAIATLIDPSLLLTMLAVDGAIVLTAAVDALWSRRPLVRVRREAAHVFSIGRRNVVTLRVRSLARRSLRVTVTDDVFADAVVGDLPAKIDLRAGGRRSIRYAVTPTRRGAYVLGDHFVRYASPLGLWQRQLRLHAEDPVRVYPDVQLVRTYERLAGQDRGASMVRARPLKGGESEFEQLREYVPGDAYRSIDWKATARRGKLVSREYQLERDQRLLLGLDAGRLLTAETAGLSLFDHALNAALMLTHIAVRGGDHVGLLTFDSEIRAFVPPASGSRAMQHIIQSSYALHPRMVASDFERGVSWINGKIRQRTLLVLFTQVNDPVAAAELVKMCRSLTPRHLPIVVMFRDVDVEALAHVGTHLDAEEYVRGAAAELLSWRDTVISQLRNAGVLVLDVRPGELTPRLVNTYLEVKARRLL